MKGRILEKAAAVACALIITAGVMRGAVLAKAEEVPVEPPAPDATFVILDMNSGSPYESASPDEAGSPSEASPRLEVTDNRKTVPLTVNDEAAGECSIIGGIPFVDAERFCRSLGMNVTGVSSNGDFSLTGDIDLQAHDGDIYFVCCGRYLYVADGVRVQNGQVLLPVEELAKCLGVFAAWDRVQWNVSVTADEVVPMESGNTYYDDTDVYWLSHVIYAEAGSQSLLGQIAVGNVVLNRVASDRFPDQDDVYSVIFAKNQFEVVINGMIYMQPDETAEIAAKLALEGYDVTDGSTYFATFFFGDGYECVKWIEDHCFMTEA